MTREIEKSVNSRTIEGALTMSTYDQTAELATSRSQVENKCQIS